MCADSTYNLWAKIQYLTLNHHNGHVLQGEMPPYDVYEFRSIPRPTIVIVTPPFNVKIKEDSPYIGLAKSKKSRSEELYLELALNWVDAGGRVVAIVPESFLFSERVKRLRESILKDARLTAVISLGAFLPNTTVKTSILIIDRENSSLSLDVFMGSINQLKPAETFDSRKIPQVALLLEEFNQWTENRQVNSNTYFQLIPRSDLNVNNLTVIHYLNQERTGESNLDLSMPLVPLIEVVEFIKRGSGITLAKHGEIAVIGPKAVRAMTLDLDNLDKTEPGRLNKSPTFAMPNDIVLNAISTYRGEAALVPESLAGTLISRNVILIRPDRSLVIPEYLVAALNSDFVKKQVERKAAGAVILAINVQALREFTIPLPSLERQQQIINQIDQARHRLKEARGQVNKAESEFRNSFQTLFVRDMKE